MLFLETLSHSDFVSWRNFFPYCGHDHLFVGTRVENLSKKKSGVIGYREVQVPPVSSDYCQGSIHLRSF